MFEIAKELQRIISLLRGCLWDLMRLLFIACECRQVVVDAHRVSPWKRNEKNILIESEYGVEEKEEEKKMKELI